MRTNPTTAMVGCKGPTYTRLYQPSMSPPKRIPRTKMTMKLLDQAPVTPLIQPLPPQPLPSNPATHHGVPPRTGFEGIQPALPNPTSADDTATKEHSTRLLSNLTISALH